MRNFTKVLMILVIPFICYQASAQSLGLKAGFNLANTHHQVNGETINDGYGMNPGFHVGLTFDVPLTGFLSFEPGLLFSTKGTKIDRDGVLGVSMTSKTNLYYLDIPLTVKAFYELGGMKVFGAAGPYAGFGLSGKVISTVEVQGTEETTDSDIKWGNDKLKDDLKRFDMGLTFGAGIEISSLMVGVYYDLGLANISAYQDFDTKTNNRVLRFSLGYKL